MRSQQVTKVSSNIRVVTTGLCLVFLILAIVGLAFNSERIDPSAVVSAQKESDLEIRSDGLQKAAKTVANPVAPGGRPISRQADGFGITGNVRDLIDGPPQFPQLDRLGNIKEDEEMIQPTEITPIVPGTGAGAEKYALRPFVDPLLSKNKLNAPLTMPTPSLTFDGVTSNDRAALFGSRSMPPDTNGDVGPNHYISIVNGPVGIYNKNTGVLATPQFKLSTLFATLAAGHPCRTNDNGDPVVLYDPLADRWIMSQFAFASSSVAPWFECIAVSTTGDPTGSWYVYGFQTPDSSGFPDYPKFGIWSDGYYMTDHQNGFVASAGGGGSGTGFFAFDRAKMLAGDPTSSYIYFNRGTAGEGGIVPGDIDGVLAPPATVPETLFRYTADEFGAPFIDAVRAYEFRPNFTTPASSTLTLRTDIPVAAFDARQPTQRADIEQPPPALATQNLDSLNDRAMFRVAYHNLGTQASPVNSYTMAWGVNVSGAPAGSVTSTTFTSGVRWTELRRDGAGNITVRDQGTQASADIDGATGTNRWMPQIAQDNQGNIAVGYSESNALTMFPSIFWAGRTGAAPTGTLNEGEVSMFTGTGVQLQINSRWGDYSSMSVDPSDDCTFFYHQEYRLAENDSISNGFAWNTRVGKFKFPTCTAAPTGTISGTITSCTSGLPINLASVGATGGLARVTGAPGTYSMTVAPGTYSVTASKSGGFTTVTQNGVVVTNGGTATANLCITGVPLIASTTASLVSESCVPANGVVDPGETVTVAFSVQNSGAANTAALTGTLQNGGGVTAAGATQSYGVLTAGGPSVTRNFTFTADPAQFCGTNITATIALNDGSSLGNITFKLPTGTAGSTPVTKSYAGPPVAIPDNDATGASAVIPVSGLTGAVSDINFRLDALAGCSTTANDANASITHPFIGDLALSLTSPAGTTVNLINNRGNGGHNYCTVTLDDQGGFPAASAITTAGAVAGNFTPESPLSAFNGENPNGNWTLKVVDNGPADTGTINRYSLIITPKVCAAGCSAPTLAVVSGRVLTADGRGLRNGTVSMTDSNNVVRVTTTSSFGFFTFDNVPIGGTYVFRISSRLFRYSSQTVQVGGDLTLPDFLGLE